MVYANNMTPLLPSEVMPIFHARVMDTLEAEFAKQFIKLGKFDCPWNDAQQEAEADTYESDESICNILPIQYLQLNSNLDNHV